MCVYDNSWSQCSALFCFLAVTDHFWLSVTRTTTTMKEIKVTPCLFQCSFEIFHYQFAVKLLDTQFVGNFILKAFHGTLFWSFLSLCLNVIHMLSESMFCLCNCFLHLISFRLNRWVVSEIGSVFCCFPAVKKLWFLFGSNCFLSKSPWVLNFRIRFEEIPIYLDNDRLWKSRNY